MGKLKEKVKEIFYDEEELELLNTRIGALRDLCDAKDITINYQRQLIETQAETIKTQRLEIDKLKDLEKEINKLKEIKYEKNSKRKSTRLLNKK